MFTDILATQAMLKAMKDFLSPQDFIDVKYKKERLKIMLNEAPICEDDFYIKDILEEKIEKHSRKIISLLAGKRAAKGISSTWRNDTYNEILIDYYEFGEDHQLRLTANEYFNFDFAKEKATSKGQRDKLAKSIKSRRLQNAKIKLREQITKIVESNPAKALQLLKPLIKT